VAFAVGSVTTYWSWCLAMYRDVEYGRGILEAVIQVTLGGPRLPWLTTVQRMGYVPAGFIVWVLLSALAAVTLFLWTFRCEPRRKASQEPAEEVGRG